MCAGDHYVNDSAVCYTLSFDFSLVTTILTCFPQGDFSVPDVPKSMAWCENSICVGFKRDYYLIRVRMGFRIKKEI